MSSDMKRRVLVLGSGARENALAFALARSASVREVVVAPGNAGSARPAADGVALVRRAAVDLAPEKCVELARDEAVDLVVVGPEAPLVAGVVDALEAAGFATFGPRKEAAALEGSKAFLKRFATRHEIPTAGYAVCTDLAAAEAAIAERGAPVVIKADGLCGGKGVVVASSVEEARSAARAMLVDRVFGDAGATVIVEDCLVGEEASVHAITDGERLLVLPPARDHKRVGDGDTGPNTGGMGAFAPSGRVGRDLLERIEREILVPTVAGMRAEGRAFRGVLFAGLMISPSGDPFLLEHNVRFGDPECEVLVPLIEGDFAELLDGVARGRLRSDVVRIARDRAALTVVLASAGYPTSPRSGDPIEGLDRAARVPGVVVHHAGTAERDGRVVTSGGRVLAVTATAATLAEARETAYGAVREISFDGMHYRRDIGG